MPLVEFLSIKPLKLHSCRKPCSSSCLILPWFVACYTYVVLQQNWLYFMKLCLCNRLPRARSRIGRGTFWGVEAVICLNYIVGLVFLFHKKCHDRAEGCVLAWFGNNSALFNLKLWVFLDVWWSLRRLFACWCKVETLHGGTNLRKRRSGCLAGWMCKVVTSLPLPSSKSSKQRLSNQETRRGWLSEWKMSDCDRGRGNPRHIHQVQTRKGGFRRL